MDGYWTRYISSKSVGLSKKTSCWNELKLMWSGTFTWPKTDAQEQKKACCGQVWLGLKEKGPGNGPFCGTMMCKTLTDLPIQITPYHSGPSGWSASKMVRPVGCPGGNEIIGTECGVNEVKHVDPTCLPLHLTCYFFQLKLDFYCQRWLHWYPLVVFEHLRYRAQLVPCSNKDPTHMSILRCSKVWWARCHHSQSVQLPSNRLNEGLRGRKRAISEVYKLFAFLLLHTKIIEKRDSKGGGKAHEPSSNILDHTEQFAPYPVDPSAHPKVGEFVGGIKKRTRVLVPSITSCLSHQLPNLQSWPHGPEEDSHLNRWFLFSTQPQRLEEGKQL